MKMAKAADRSADVAFVLFVPRVLLRKNDLDAVPYAVV
jgi:hypothetical protein